MSPSQTEHDQVSGLPRHVVGVAGVVVDDTGRALTVRRHTPARWELPGGALEYGERIIEGLAREVREEIGLAVSPLRLTGIYQNMALGPVALVFLCRREGGSERLSDETTDWRWVHRAEAESLMPPAWSVRFADAWDAWDALAAGRTPDGPKVRAHDGTSVL